MITALIEDRIVQIDKEIIDTREDIIRFCQGQGDRSEHIRKLSPKYRAQDSDFGTRELELVMKHLKTLEVIKASYEICLFRDALDEIRQFQKKVEEI